ncbi:MAG: glycosyl hydrolase [Paludibacter sp.]|nr:glycosyl hydrolase [Paludibacter sp.]
MKEYRSLSINILILFIIIANAAFGKNSLEKLYFPVDGKATFETKALFFNLRKIQQTNILVGQHDATMYGHTWSGDDNRSDMKDVCGSHPALIGFDFALVTNKPSAMTQNRSEFMVRRIIETYNRGGVVTMCWHTDNPFNNQTAWVDTTKTVVNTVKELLPGGKAHEAYKNKLKQIAQIAKSIVGADGHLVPMIFRPFHEMEGGWFWWGRPYRTPEEFKTLWRFTVEYLRDSLQVHNFLYAFSTDCKFKTREQYLIDYPGDKYVDVLGMDDYWDFRPDGANNSTLAAEKVKIVSDLAQQKEKIAAMTETGLESITDSTWFTKKLLPVLRYKDSKLAYVMFWRNDNHMKYHFFAPFPGHNSVPDFLKFYNEDYTLFEKDLKGIYK